MCYPEGEFRTGASDVLLESLRVAVDRRMVADGRVMTTTGITGDAWSTDSRRPIFRLSRSVFFASVPSAAIDLLSVARSESRFLALG